MRAVTRVCKPNWFETLSEALDAEGLLDTWELHFEPISYGENRRYQANGRQICLYRETDGRYERPVHYKL